MISIEMPCATMSPAQISTLAKIPTLVMFGDHLGDVQGGGPANWNASYQGCQTFVQQLKAAGGDAEMMYLPQLGIKGNSHMLMQDRNNLDLADLLIAWIDQHVESKKRQALERSRGKRSNGEWSIVSCHRRYLTFLRWHQEKVSTFDDN